MPSNFVYRRILCTQLQCLQPVQWPNQMQALTHPLQPPLQQGTTFGRRSTCFSIIISIFWMCNEFKWCYITRTNGFGLGLVAEENLEACHKIARPTRQCAARLTNAADNLTDTLTKWDISTLSDDVGDTVLCRLNVRSDPCVRGVTPTVSCSFCDSVSV